MSVHHTYFILSKLAHRNPRIYIGVEKTINLLQGKENQPGMQGHHAQNKDVVGVLFPDQEDHQFLKCRIGPGINIHH